MRHLYLSLVASSPIAIRADQAEGGAASAKYIPGSTLRGSLATAHQMLYPDRKDEFARLFLDEQVRFPHLYPALFRRSSRGLETRNRPVKPLPKTAQTCKRFPGFQPLRGEEVVEERHGIRDSLLDWALFTLLEREDQPVSALLAPLEHHAICTFPDCQRAMDHADGYYRCAPNQPQQRMLARSITRLQTRTGINRDWGVVEEGVLYNREVFADGMRFWGELLFPDEDELPAAERRITLFQSFLQEVLPKENSSSGVAQPSLARLGTGRTRGLGCIALAHDPLEVEREDLAFFRQRLETFDAALKAEARNLGVERLDAFYFAITLTSAAILRDPYLRYQKTLDTTMLGKLLKLKDSRTSFQQIYQAIGMQRIAGWNEVWGTPRPTDYALEMGSTFLFASSNELDSELLEALYLLEEVGIGQRHAEGFGRICVSDPFHLKRCQWKEDSCE